MTEQSTNGIDNLSRTILSSCRVISEVTSQVEAIQRYLGDHLQSRLKRIESVADISPAKSSADYSTRSDWLTLSSTYNYHLTPKPLRSPRGCLGIQMALSPELTPAQPIVEFPHLVVMYFDFETKRPESWGDEDADRALALRNPEAGHPNSDDAWPNSLPAYDGGKLITYSDITPGRWGISEGADELYTGWYLAMRLTDIQSPDDLETNIIKPVCALFDNSTSNLEDIFAQAAKLLRFQRHPDIENGLSLVP